MVDESKLTEGELEVYRRGLPAGFATEVWIEWESEFPQKEDDKGGGIE